MKSVSFSKHFLGVSGLRKFGKVLVWLSWSCLGLKTGRLSMSDCNVSGLHCLQDANAVNIQEDDQIGTKISVNVAD